MPSIIPENDLTAATAASHADSLRAIQSGDGRKMPMEVIFAPESDIGVWRRIPSSRYTATPASQTTITMSNTTGLKPGQPVRVNQVTNGDIWAIITAVTTNTSISLAGQLVAANDINAMYVGPPSNIVVLNLDIAGSFAAATGDILASIGKTPRKWQHGAARLVRFSCICQTADATSDPEIQVKVDTTPFGTTTAVGTTWADAINSTSHNVDYNDTIEITVTTAGGAGDAADLTVQAVFILE